MKIYISSDHAGFALKGFLVQELTAIDYDVEDLGPKTLDTNDDYPQTTKGAIQKVQGVPESRGILICKNGVGVTIFANRFRDVRAGLSWTKEHAKSQRLDDNTNILTLPADFITFEEALEITLEWLQTEFEGKERHKRRLTQIENLSK